MQVEILIKFEYTGVLRDKTIQDKLMYTFPIVKTKSPPLKIKPISRKVCFKDNKCEGIVIKLWVPV